MMIRNVNIHLHDDDDDKSTSIDRLLLHQHMAAQSLSARRARAAACKAKHGLVYSLAYLLLGIGMETYSAAIPDKCPLPSDIQSKKVKESFDDTKMEGFWYELAMKDATQPRMCKCQTSEKVVTETIIHDNFTIECAGDTYFSDLTFERLDHGVSAGTWNGIPLIDEIVFPNTVIDYKEKDDGSYEWFIEFQCVDGPDGWGNAFYAFNFYAASYENANETITEMERSFRAAGLGAYIDTGLDLAIIDHTNCLYGHDDDEDVSGVTNTTTASTLSLSYLKGDEYSSGGTFVTYSGLVAVAASIFLFVGA